MIKQLLTSLIPLILFNITVDLYCQELTQTDITDIAEDLAADETDPGAATIFMERLHELAENPVSLNSANEAELSRLFFLTDFQIKSLAGHIKSTGSVLSVFEIASIAGFDIRTAQIMNPFITLETASSGINKPVKLRNSILSNIIIKPGETDNSYIGPPWKFLMKYKTDAGRLSAGFTIEKDAGEKIFSGSPPLPDFISGYIAFNGSGVIRKIIAGDFSAKFGQGSSINTGFNTGVPLTATGYFPSRSEIRPYTSSDENNFFRGIATELIYKKLSLNLFFSHNRIDATLSSADDSARLFITNFQKSGLHNTNSLIMKKDAVSEIFHGINLSYYLNSFTAGINWSESIFSFPIEVNHYDPATLFDFRGEKKGMISAYYTGSIGKSLFSGEFSTDYGNNYAIIQSYTMKASGRLTINCLYRKYTPGFGGLHCRGPGNSSSGGNEEGILGNFTFEAAKNLYISAGYDLCRYPWLKYRTSFPSQAKKSEIKIRYLPSLDFNVEISFNHRTTSADKHASHGMPGISVISSETLKTIARYSLNERFSLRCRIDYKTVDKGASKGVLMSQDLIYSFRSIPFSLWGRYCLFNTDDWDSRLYIYEDDLLYSYSIPAYSGTGSSTYLMAKWEFGNYAELRLKYALTSLVQQQYMNKDRDEIRLQIRINF